MSFDEHDFRHCMGCFATGVTVVSSLKKENPIGITINSFASLSLAPPQILFCLEKKSSNIDVFIQGNKFNVNILAENQGYISKHFASSEDKSFGDILFNVNEHKIPIIEGVIAVVECEIEAIHYSGDHIIIIGGVNSLTKKSDAKPLIYFHGNYAKLKD